MKIKIAYLKEYQEYVPALGQWSFDTWSKFNPTSTRKGQIEKFKAHCNIDTLPLTLVALDEMDRLLGMCSLRESDGIRPDLTPWLASLFVVPSHRNKKIAEKLIAATKRVAKEMGFDILYLLTFESSLNAYYARHGWELIGNDKLNEHPVSVMETKLV